MIFFPEGRKLDFIAQGRAGLDLYAAEENTNFNEVLSFKKFIGGSPGNITAMLAALGRKTGLITKVSADLIGQYVISYFNSIGTDTTHIAKDSSGGRTSLAITEMKPKDCGVIIYRNNASDQLLEPDEISEEYIANAAGLIVSGFALSETPGREAALTAIEYARRMGTRVILDLDYRPYSWRSSYDAALYMGMAAEKSDILIGNDEEFAVLNKIMYPDAVNDGRKAVTPWLKKGCSLVIYKQGGGKGAMAFEQNGQIHEGRLYYTKVQKPFGAGDAFLGTTLHYLMKKWDVATAIDRGAAAASIVISRKSCSAASPTEQELDNFIQNYTGGTADA
ncbi:MAG: 5-dehydro-2-deoxygluconokinase [Bacteroidetes bacterium]|nr:5-dehydro-2-deoxygluconokinase [Bacteroidota bacterium]